MQPTANAFVTSVISQADFAGEALPADAWTPGGFEVDPAEQMRFEGLLAGDRQVAVVQPGELVDRGQVTHATLGDAILDSLKTLKDHSVTMQEELSVTLGKGEITSADLLQVQYRLMSFNVELQTTTNMAHHGVEDIKTIMRGQ